MGCQVWDTLWAEWCCFNFSFCFLIRFRHWTSQESVAYYLVNAARWWCCLYKCGIIFTCSGNWWLCAGGRWTAKPTVPGSAFVFLNVFTGLVVTRLVAHVVKFVKQLLVCCSQNAQKSCLAYLWLPQYGMLWKFSYTRRTTWAYISTLSLHFE